MSKRALIIMNPCSGTKRANKYLTDIVETFTVNDYVCTVLTTTKRGDGTLYAQTYAPQVDLITCIGGDGTFNEVVSGLVHSGAKVPIGYIPAGSTNDFAKDVYKRQVVFREVHTENSQRVVLRISPGRLRTGSTSPARFCTGSVDTRCAACGEQAEQEQSQQRLQCRPRRTRACYVCMGIFGFAAHAFTLPCGG